MAIKWPPEVPAFPPSCSQPLAFYSSSSQQPECHSSALNLPMAPTTQRGKAQVIPVPFAIWPHCLSDLISYHFSLRILPHRCSPNKTCSSIWAFPFVDLSRKFFPQIYTWLALYLPSSLCPALPYQTRLP